MIPSPATPVSIKASLFCIAIMLLFGAGAKAQNASGETQYFQATPTPTPARTRTRPASPTPVPARTVAPARSTPARTPAPASRTPAPPRSASPARTPTPAPRTPTPAAVAVPRVAATPALAKQENVNDIARFIAGLPPEHDNQLAELAKTPEWTAYAASMNERWPRFDTNKLQQIRLWSPKELAKAHISTVFYPFSGPDIIYAATYFPQAASYILCGLEPVGDVPSKEKLQPLANSLGWLQASFKTLLNAGYFVTSDMSVELKMSPMQGTVPVMCVMLARSGSRITSISTNSYFAEIHFIPASGGQERALYYFSTDLSNGGIGKGGPLLAFLNKMHPDTAYVKSASYLMHEDDFSAIRNLLLTRCRTIVQDDSGIPLRDFDQRRWKLKLYGTYAAPLDIFAKYKQQDLADLYAKTPAVTPLTFSVGYHWKYDEANLLVATMKSPAEQAAATLFRSTTRLRQ